jgi:diguanylate cyclase (GGDEF)-like protein
MTDRNLESLGKLADTIDEIRQSSDSDSVGLLFGELNGLKNINTRYGYLAGDTALETFHKKLQSIARSGDCAVRISGTLFALVIKDPLHEGHALLAAEKIAQLAEEWIVLATARLRLEVRIGVSLLPSLASSSQELMEQAEAAKRFSCSISERFAIWREDLRIKSGTQTHALFDAKVAIENGEFRMLYQPKIDLATGEPCGAEALVRWQSPDGLVSPQNFLSELERARAMAPLLQYVANSAAREVARWSRYLPNFAISVNATTTDIEDSDLVEVLESVLSMWNINPRHLILEVTETMLMIDVEQSIDTLRKLKKLNIRTSIDDFGTGYSSLAYLRDLPVDEIKIDRSFVLNILSDEQDRKIVQTLIDLAHAMNLSVVAEGIESKDIADSLSAMGCDIGQGFYFGKPINAKSFEEHWLKQNNAPAGTP